MAACISHPRVSNVACHLHNTRRARSGATAWHMPCKAFIDSTTAAPRIRGEWDGLLVSFNSRGEPVELPHSVVPDAFREWGVTLVAWQTQCSMHCSTSGDLHYTLRRLFPTVGCEGARRSVRNNPHPNHSGRRCV